MFGKKKEEERVTKIAAWVDSLHDKLNRIEKVQNLILAEMNLTYQPETEKKEPARLVEKKAYSLPKDFGGLISEMAAYDYFAGQPPTKPKKKRGRPMKK